MADPTPSTPLSIDALYPRSLKYLTDGLQALRAATGGDVLTDAQPSEAHLAEAERP